MRVRIVTDSSKNIPDATLARLEIVEAPAVVNFGQASFLVDLGMPVALGGPGLLGLACHPVEDS